MQEVSKKDVLSDLTPLSGAKAQLSEDALQEKRYADALQSENLLNMTVEIDPKRCRPWKYHNRDTAWLTKDCCFDLINSIQRNNQLEPALVRSLKNDPNCDWEVIYGVRRWFACSQIPDRPLLARVTHADDKTCMVLMHTENADSKDISEFERAYSFAQQMKTGIFKTQAEMADAIGVSQGLISRMINAAELFDYEWIKVLFPDKLHIKIKPAYELVSMLKDQAKKELIQKAAKKIEQQRNNGEKFTTEEVLKKLIASGDPSKNLFEKKEIILSLGENQAIYCKRESTGRVTLVFDSAARSRQREELIEATKKAIDQFILNKVITG